MWATSSIMPVRWIAGTASARWDLFASLGLAARQEILRFAQDEKADRGTEVSQ
jgi:hypothetical protein